MTTLASELRRVVGADALVDDDEVRRYLADETETRSLVGSCAAVVRPASAEQVAATVRWACERGVPLVPRGGGTGYAGGAVPRGDSVVVSLERLDRVRSFDPLLWRMEVEAGVTTRRVQELARENGLYYPPDPGAGEQSHIGGNVATNAGGPHAFKYGTTGNWVTGIEAVVPPGELIRVGGAIRKDVAGYDLKSLLIGSEGTLGIVTSVWLRLIPRPEASLPVVALYPSDAAGVDAIASLVGSGLLVAALEYVDGGALAAAQPRFLQVDVPAAGFVVLCEADGSAREAEELRAEVVGVLGEGAVALQAPTDPAAVSEIWRWREGMTAAVTGRRGGKVSEDIVVPLDRLHEAIERTRSIGDELGLPACSWGHAGDGNLHSTFMVDRHDEAELAAAERAAERLFELAIELGGSISGEHGLGLVKSGHLELLWPGRGAALHAGLKQLFDPQNILNPGKKR